MKIQIDPNASSSHYLKAFEAFPLSYFANERSVKADGKILTTPNHPLLRKTQSVDVEVHFFAQQDYIHNETAFGHIYELGQKPAILEMLILAIPHIQSKQEMISLDGEKAKVVCALGTYALHPEKGLGAFAYKPETDEIVLISVMTYWSNPWNSREICYLTFPKG